MTVYPSNLTPKKEVPHYAPDWYTETPLVAYNAELPPSKQQPVRPKIKLSTTLISVFFLLAIFKQTGVLAWSWWWVSLPLWLMPISYGLLVIVVILLCLWHELKRAGRFKKR